ncbi:unnamed protein product [Parascedosporium putredinis]|uniref:PARP-type domain-containing protein n=1 Tax=Parascedosporium putredinis TaxID=1442378 RepID=A0A9P1GUX3_9PEZI|nr:unnamed protein product [Parascedosporium putredinis]CAI7988099.1 unnamed protein product [Parascedosporium putredinis]
MPEYRVEISPSARALCQDTHCKRRVSRLQRGATWKHWGCVSGLQMQQVQELCDKNEDGNYSFDFFDGYDDLNDHADVQAKIRRCVEQGHIDADDFKGDPDYNVPGKRGIRAPARRGKAQAATDDEDEAEKPKSKPKAASKKGKRSRDEEDDEDEVDSKPSKPAKKAKKGTQPKAEVAGKDEEEAKPAKKAKTKRAKADSDAEEEDSKPSKNAKAAATAKKSRVAQGSEEDEVADTKPAKKTKAKKAAPVKNSRKAKEESEAEADDAEEEEEEEQKQKKESKPKAAPKKAVKTKRCRQRKTPSPRALAQEVGVAAPVKGLEARHQLHCRALGTTRMVRMYVRQQIPTLSCIDRRT